VTSDLDALYRDVILDHNKQPRNFRALDGARKAEGHNPVCGDRLRLMLRIRNQRIEAAGFLAYGCPPTLVCGSMLTELLTGKTVDEAMLLSRTELVAAVGGLPSRKQHAAALAIEAVRSAIENKSSGGKPSFPTHS